MVSLPNCSLAYFPTYFPYLFVLPGGHPLHPQRAQEDDDYALGDEDDSYA